MIETIPATSPVPAEPFACPALSSASRAAPDMFDNMLAHALTSLAGPADSVPVDMPASEYSFVSAAFDAASSRDCPDSAISPGLEPTPPASEDPDNPPQPGSPDPSRPDLCLTDPEVLLACSGPPAKDERAWPAPNGNAGSATVDIAAGEEPAFLPEMGAGMAGAGMSGARTLAGPNRQPAETAAEDAPPVEPQLELRSQDGVPGETDPAPAQSITIRPGQPGTGTGDRSGTPGAAAANQDGASLALPPDPPVGGGNRTSSNAKSFPPARLPSASGFHQTLEAPSPSRDEALGNLDHPSPVQATRVQPGLREQAWSRGTISGMRDGAGFSGAPATRSAATDLVPHDPLVSKGVVTSSVGIDPPQTQPAGSVPHQVSGGRVKDGATPVISPRPEPDFGGVLRFLAGRQPSHPGMPPMTAPGTDAVCGEPGGERSHEARPARSGEPVRSSPGQLESERHPPEPSPPGNLDRPEASGEPALPQVRRLASLIAEPTAACPDRLHAVSPADSPPLGPQRRPQILPARGGADRYEVQSTGSFEVPDPVMHAWTGIGRLQPAPRPWMHATPAGAVPIAPPRSQSPTVALVRAPLASPASILPPGAIVMLTTPVPRDACHVLDVPPAETGVATGTGAGYSAVPAAQGSEPTTPHPRPSCEPQAYAKALQWSEMPAADPGILVGRPRPADASASEGGNVGQSADMHFVPAQETVPPPTGGWFSGHSVSEWKGGPISQTEIGQISWASSMPPKPLKPAENAAAADGAAPNILVGPAANAPAAAKVADTATNPSPQAELAFSESDFPVRLAEHLHSQVSEGKDTLRIQLKPNLLGRLVIKAESGGAGVCATIVTENGIAKECIEQNLSVLYRSLQDLGLKIDRIVVLGDGWAQDAGGNPAFRDERPAQDQQQQSRHSSWHPREAEEAPDPAFAPGAQFLPIWKPHSTFHTVA